MSAPLENGASSIEVESTKVGTVPQAIFDSMLPAAKELPIRRQKTGV
jgi:hypothetical protein